LISEEQLCFSGRIVQISQVLINLLNNAFAAVQGTEEPWVKISIKHSDGLISIYIDDSGRSINSHIKEKLFQPFFSTKVVGEGMGLGLSTSKGIIEDHGGRIYFDDTQGHTRFVIELKSKERRR